MKLPHELHRAENHPECALCQTNGNPCREIIDGWRMCGRPLGWYGPHPHDDPEGWRHAQPS